MNDVKLNEIKCAIKHLKNAGIEDEMIIDIIDYLVDFEVLTQKQVDILYAQKVN